MLATIKCPYCGSTDIYFDAHAGFAYCRYCKLNSELEGPSLFRDYGNTEGITRQVQQ